MDDEPNYAARREAIGLIAEKRAQLELTVALVVATLMGDKGVGRAATSRLSMSQAIRLARDLSRLRLDAEGQQRLGKGPDGRSDGSDSKQRDDSCSLERRKITRRGLDPFHLGSCSCRAT